MEQYAHDQIPDWVERLPNGMPDYPMARNLKVRPECIGLELPSVPFADKTSAQRMNMYTTSAPQALIVNGAEFPQVSSGFEKEYLKYTFNDTRFDQEGIIVRVIPKFSINDGETDYIKHCPEYFVLWYGKEDKKIHLSRVKTYYKGTNGFGWENFIERYKLAPGTHIEKDECLSHSNAVQGTQYCLGVNANTCYITLPGTVEDAVIVSESFAKRTIATGYREVIIDIDKSMVPVNLYGDYYNYKFMPDIGEKIGHGGILCALRKVDELTFYTDFTDEALMQIQPLHDDVYYNIEPGATVVDITVIRNPNKKLLTPMKVFQQIEKYEDAHYAFHRAVIKAYEEECVAKGLQPSHEFNAAIVHSGRILSTVDKRVLNATRKSLAKFKRKDMPISHIQISAIIKYDIKPSKGSKITGSFGDKGVISQVVADEHMPINDDGVRAEIIASPMGVPNRMNTGQLYYTFVSEMCRKVMERMRAERDQLIAYDIMLEAFRDINVEYANVIEDLFRDNEGKVKFVKEILQGDYLVVVIPPFLDGITAEWVLQMRDKYDIRQSPVSFDIVDSSGKVIRHVARTKRSMFIGKKYVFMLCKVPFCKAPGMGFVNEIGVPISVKDSVTKTQTPISPTAIRAGEDETRCLVNNISPTLAARLLGINANAPESTQLLVSDLLRVAKPTQLMFISNTDEDIRNNSRPIAALRAIMAVTGIDITDSIASQEEIENYYKPFERLLEEKHGGKK